MAVNLSPVGGVAAQFFTNSGAVLTGGKLYTYAAGTTTPQAAYTTSQGNVPWTNPIVLDAAGRVPSGGEIWLTDGLIYKFVLKDSNDVLIATYDNITGINDIKADEIPYTPEGTGAVTTTVQNKLRSMQMRESRDVGFIYNNPSAAASNLAILNSIGGGDILFFLNGDTLHIAANPINNNTALFDHVVIDGSGGGVFNITSGGTLFTIANGGSAIADKVNITATSSRSELFATTYDTDTRVNLISVTDCVLDGYVRFAIEVDKNWNQNPAVALNGVEQFIFERNIVSNSNDASIWMVNAMYDLVTIKDNVFTDCKGMYVYNSVVNTSPNYHAISAAMKSMIVTGNKFENGINFFMDSALADFNSYAGFVLWEGNQCQYANNYCKNFQAKDAVTTGGVYDIYMGGRWIEMVGNQTINRFNFTPSAAIFYAENPCLKIKIVENAFISAHRHIYEDGYFEHQSTVNGLSYVGQRGDFFAIEHSVASYDGPAYDLVIQNSEFELPVLNNTFRNNFDARSIKISGNTFVSNGTGFSLMIGAKTDAAVNTGLDARPATFEVSDNYFQLYNATLGLAIVQVGASKPVAVAIERNSGVVGNLEMFTSGPGGLVGIRNVSVSGNQFTVNSANAQIINRFANMPVMESLQLDNNVINAPNANGNNSLYGGVASTGIRMTASCRFTTPVAGDILLETIIGKDAASPMYAQPGLYIIKGVLYQEDYVNFAAAYDFMITYRIDVSGPNTIAYFDNAAGVYTSANSGIISNNSIKVTTTHPNMTARFPSGAVGSNTLSLFINFGAGGTVRTADVTVIKVN